MKSNYYIVRAVCGDVGKGKAVDKDFAVYAHSGREAAAIARDISRVKHDFKYAIKAVLNVDFITFVTQKAINEMDPYLNCGNIQEQQILCPNMEPYLLHEEAGDVRKNNKTVSKKAYVNNYCFHNDFEGEY